MKAADKLVIAAAATCFALTAYFIAKYVLNERRAKDAGSEGRLDDGVKGA